MSKTTYDLQSVKLPRLVGGTLRVFVSLLENPATRGLIIPKLLQRAGLTSLRALTLDDPPTFWPRWDAREPQAAPGDWTRSLQATRTPSHGFTFATTRAYHDAYRNGVTTPDQVAERLLAAIEESNAHTPPLRAIIACHADDVRAQARASSDRWRAGKPRSVFDGVPVAVKDEMDMVPYGTTWGTRFLGKTPARADATIVARLRSAGALLIGKANMHEIGIGVTGLNPHHGVTRNPYNVAHFTGGSSSGSATAVAAGLCPAALAADGGGSIRIPSAFCGVVGLKPTFGRVSTSSSAALCWSVAHNGPIGATAEDVALLYAIIAGPDPNDPHTLHQPPVTLDRFDDVDLRDVTIGVFTPWLEHASPAMVAGCRRILDALRTMGARARNRNPRTRSRPRRPRGRHHRRDERGSCARVRNASYRLWLGRTDKSGVGPFFHRARLPASATRPDTRGTTFPKRFGASHRHSHAGNGLYCVRHSQRCVARRRIGFDDVDGDYALYHTGQFDRLAGDCVPCGLR